MTAIEKFRRIAGEQIHKNFPTEQILEFKVRYNFIKDIDGVMLKFPLVLIDGRRYVDVSITLANGREFYGRSVCSKQDNFCKSFGRKQALIRACRVYWELKSIA